MLSHMSEQASQNVGHRPDGDGERAALPVWDGAAYAANTAHHRVFDDAYLSSTPIEPGQRLLDLGCGSGDLTATLAGVVGSEGHVVGVDAQPSMLAEAAQRAGANQSFVR